MPVPSSSRPRTWTAGTIVLLVVCALVAGGSVAAAALLPGHIRDGARREAESTLQTFLADATALDPDWQDTSSPLLDAVVPIGAPLLGESTTAEALNLSADYEVRGLSFSGDTAERSDTASAVVVVHYRYTILGEKGTASIPQKVWLTRPFYYRDGTPRRIDPTAAPRAIGPWQVVGITVPSTADLGGKAPRSSFDLTSEERSGDSVACYSPLNALVQVADNARIHGTLASSCFLGAEDGSDAVAAGVDPAALLEAFPAIDETDPASIPPELTRVEADLFHGLRSPFTQYLIDGRYAVTFAAVTTGEDDEAVRLVSIQQTEGAK